jgi:hypothetical protein
MNPVTQVAFVMHEFCGVAVVSTQLTLTFSIKEKMHSIALFPFSGWFMFSFAFIDHLCCW